MVPVDGDPPIAPSTAHVTPPLSGSSVTTAVKTSVCDEVTDEYRGVTLTFSPAPISVMIAVADWLGSATATAVSVTVAGTGGLRGAAYCAEVDVTFNSVPHDAPEHPAPDRPNVAPRFKGSFRTLT